MLICAAVARATKNVIVVHIYLSVNMVISRLAVKGVRRAAAMVGSSVGATRIKKVLFFGPGKCPIDPFGPVANQTILEQLHAAIVFASVLHTASIDPSDPKLPEETWMAIR